MYLILCARVTYVCLGNGINIDTALVEMADDDIIHFKNTVKRADIMDRYGEIIATSLPTVNLVDGILAFAAAWEITFPFTKNSNAFG